MLVLPLPALEPDHEPLAVQAVGLLVTLQLTVALEPVPMVAGATAIVTTGATAPPPPDVTLTVVVAESAPPALLQVNVYE